MNTRTTRPVLIAGPVGGRFRRAALLSPLLAALVVMPLSAAQAQTDPREGKLDKYINLDSDDISTKLEVIEQEVFVEQQKSVMLQFQMEHPNDIAISFVQYPSGDVLIPAYIFTRKTPAVGKRPAIVLVHGGFHERLNVEWFPLISEFIKRGYVVIFPEYRGSRGYGENLYQNDYGVTDTADVLAAAKYIGGKPFVDGSRIGVVGESRGGMTTLLAIEKEPRTFKVAVDIVGLTDFVAYMAYKPEYRRKEVAKESASLGGKLPNENLAAYMAISPVNGVAKIETPLLILATTGDKIAPLTLHTGRLIESLKANNKVFQSKIYENAPGGHVFMHGDTAERADAFSRITAWLQTYLKP